MEATWPAMQCSVQWRGLQCQQMQQGTWESKPVDNAYYQSFTGTQEKCPPISYFDFGASLATASQSNEVVAASKLSAVKIQFKQGWLGFVNNVYLDKMTVETPFLCSMSITARASFSFVMVWPEENPIPRCYPYITPVRSSASNWLGIATSAKGKITSWYTGSSSLEVDEKCQ